MRHQVDGRKFGRNTSHRKAMFRNLANAVVLKEQVVTTVQKAKEARRVVDRLITLAKRGTPAARRLVFDRTRDNDVVTKIFGTLLERYKGRPGGYTRVLRMAERRWGDAAEMAVFELVDRPELDRKRKAPGAGSKDADSREAADKKKADSEAKPTDPFGRFRKMFGGKSKVASGGGPGKGARTAKSGAARKTPTAGGGGNKSGGAS